MPENSSITEISDHIPCGYSMSKNWGFYHIEYKHTLNRGKYCVKKVCDSLKECTKNRFDFEKKKILPLTKKELKSYRDVK